MTLDPHFPALLPSELIALYLLSLTEPKAFQLLLILIALGELVPDISSELRQLMPPCQQLSKLLR